MIRRRAASGLFMLWVLIPALGAGELPTRPPRKDPGVSKVDFLINRPSGSAESIRARDAVPSKKADARRARSPAIPGPRERPPATPVLSPGTTTTEIAGPEGTPLGLDPRQALRSVSTVALFAMVSLAPAAVLMLTAFVRIQIVLVLLRQALGSPQVPGNQVLTALALLLTALVMRPVGEVVYTRAIRPYADGQATWSQAYRAGSRPVKAFMLEQLQRTNHAHYFWAIHDEVVPPGQADPKTEEDYPIEIVATAYLLSELTTALFIGFLLYLPFLVVDLVVSAVLAAMGLFMLPPSLVSLPLKLILFVLASGWLKVATMLLRGFGPVLSSS
ncbi:MAG: flagellar type III secretion system pore protein FliP [Isosphaeraceae bacterium]